MQAQGPRGFTIRALGEIAIRCRDLAAMERFYRDVLGLRPLTGGHRETIRFFALGESYGGHTAVLALFADETRGDGVGTGALHHLALTVEAGEQEAARAWLTARGHDCRVETFPWIGWRGLFTRDPEGNTVELVAQLGPGTG